MLNIINSIIFGIIEGITEWLPISSTGHLILAESFIKFEDISEEFWKMFLVVIQFGAILAVILLFFNKIWPIKIDTQLNGKKVFKIDKNIIKLWIKILISCIPAVLIVLFGIDEYAEDNFENPITIAIMLILVGIAFIIVEKRKIKKTRVTNIEGITYRDALIIGLFQVIAAIFPGTSRSGATIIGALLIGISRVAATEFTFYLAIPAMAGASLLKILKYELDMSGEEIAILLVGMFTAFIVSVLVIKFLMNYIKKHDFVKFGWYRIVIGVLVIILFNMGVIEYTNNSTVNNNLIDYNYQIVDSETKKNTSKKINESKTFEGLMISNLSFIERHSQNTMIASVKNVSGKKMDNRVKVKIILLDEENKEIGDFIGVVAPLDVDEITQLNIGTTKIDEYINAYDYKVEIIK